MLIARPTFHRFASAVHRRHVALRLLERTGLGLLIGSVIGLLLLPLLLRADRPAVLMVAGIILLGGGLGLLWGNARRPSRLDSVMHADRQLSLDDLLATALSIISQPTDPWADAVLAMADDRCKSLTPGSVALKRLDARAWGGIGLSAAAALSAALFFGSSPDSCAAANRSGASAIKSSESPASPATDPRSDPADRPLIALGPAAPPAALEHDDPASRAVSQSAPRPSAGRSPPGPTPRDDGARHQADGTAAPGTGNGSSQTDKKPVAPTPAQPSAGPHEAGNDRDSRHAVVNLTRPANSSGSPDAGRAPGPDHPGGAASGAAQARKTRVTEPWKTDDWPSDVQRAHEALDAGLVPPAYQELVRRYFDRP